jgi:hypothetical protein
MPSVVLHIPQINLKRERNIREGGIQYIELTPQYLRYYRDVKLDVPVNEDEAMGWKQVRKSNDVYVRPEAITAVDLTYYAESKMWQISIEAMGYSWNINVQFMRRDEEKARALTQKLRGYVFEKILPSST